MPVTTRSVLWLALLLAGATAVLSADTLYLRDGSRIQGELIAFRSGTIEFQERRGFGGGRMLRIDRDEVVRIELDAPGRGGDFERDNRDRDASGRNAPDRGDRERGGRAAGMRERQVIVSGDVPWNDTGIEVRAGQTVYFEATGQVRWGKDRRDGPEGENNSPPNAGRPMPNRNAAALIGRIGAGGGDVFFIGDAAGEFRMRASGRLFLGVNDDFLQDNAGNFRVVVYY